MPRRDPQATFQLPGEMGRRFNACKALFEERWSKLPTGDSIEDLHAWCCDTKEALLDFFTQHPAYDCTIYDRLGRIICPDPAAFDTPPAYAAALGPVVAQVTSIGAEYLRYCLCAALLPPCPAPTMSNCVPLATIRVRKADCKILQVCNWGPRRLVVTFPSLGYWLDTSDFLQNLHRALEQLCCTPLRPKNVRVSGQPPLVGVGSAEPSMVGSIPMSGPSRTAFSMLFSESWRNRRRTIDAQTLLLGAVGATDEKNQPFASDLEIANPLPFLLLNQVVRPTLDATLPPELGNLLETLASGAAPPSGAAELAVRDEIAVLRHLIADLQNTVQDQGNEINRLRAGRNE